MGAVLCGCAVIIRCTGGEAPAGASLAPRLGPLGVVSPSCHSPLFCPYDQTSVVRGEHISTCQQNDSDVLVVTVIVLVVAVLLLHGRGVVVV